MTSLQTKKIPQAEVLPKDYRSCGWFESLGLGDCFQVKRIYVKPSSALTLQRHRYCSEHCVVEEGLATATIEQSVTTIIASQSIYEPLGSVHRLENQSEDPVMLIEEQIGSFLGEDDIQGFADDHNRNGREGI